MRLAVLTSLMLMGWSFLAVADGPKTGSGIVPGKTYKAADADAPLPVGWPGGTEPGKVEIKSYPTYRSAVARGKGVSMGSDNMLFWPLFNHISRNNIAMTAPVVSTYTNEMAENPKALGNVSMEFLYQSTEQGSPGQGTGPVKVEDHPAGQFVCLGIQGGMNNEKMVEGVKTLKTWLEDHKAEWVEAGPPRRLGYHGPMTPTSQRLWEVQIPVKKK